MVRWGWERWFRRQFTPALGQGSTWTNPALLVSVLLMRWSVWIVLKWFVRRLVSTLLSWSCLFFFKKTLIERETPTPFMENSIKNFHFVFIDTSQRKNVPNRLNIMSPCGVNVKRLPTDKYGLSLTRAFAQVTSTRPTCKLQLARCEDSGRSDISWISQSEVCTSIWPACNPGKAQGSLIFEYEKHEYKPVKRISHKPRNCVWMVSTSSSQWPRRRLVWVLIRWTWLKLMVAVTEAQDCINNQPLDSTLSIHVTCDQL